MRDRPDAGLSSAALPLENGLTDSEAWPSVWQPWVSGWGPCHGSSGRIPRKTLWLADWAFGFGNGSMAPLMPYLLSDRFGRQRLGVAYGLLIFFASGFGGGFGPLLGGYIYDKTGAYDLGWILCTVTLLIVALYILTLKRPA